MEHRRPVTHRGRAALLVTDPTFKQMLSDHSSLLLSRWNKHSSSVCPQMFPLWRMMMCTLAAREETWFSLCTQVIFACHVCACLCVRAYVRVRLSLSKCRGCSTSSWWTAHRHHGSGIHVASVSTTWPLFRNWEPGPIMVSSACVCVCNPTVGLSFLHEKHLLIPGNC